MSDWEKCLQDEIDHCPKCEKLNKLALEFGANFTKCAEHIDDAILDDKQKKLFKELIREFN